MKSLEELHLLDREVLKKIAGDLDLSFAKNISTDNLVQKVFEAQQPDQEQVEDETKRAESDKAKEAEKNKAKEESAEDQVDAMLSSLGEFFGGDVIEEGENEDGEFLFAIVDVAGETLAAGTFAELQTARENMAASRAKAQFDSAKDLRNALDTPKERDGGGEQPAPTPASGDQLAKIDGELSHMKKLGLKYEVTGTSVSLSYRNKQLETTVHQPVHRVVKLAEQMLASR